MEGQRRAASGFSLVELLIGTSLVLLVVASVFGLVSPAQHAFQTQTEATDLQQRLRVGVDAIARELRQAGAGPYQGRQWTAELGPVGGLLPSVLPFRQGRRRPDPPGTFRNDTLTLLRVNPGAAQTTIAQALPAQTATVQVNTDPGCPLGDPACGFRVGMTVVVFEGGGSYDLFSVAAVEGSALALQHNGPDTPFIYPPNTSRIAEATSRTYWLKTDAITDTFQLAQYDGAGGADVPVVDHVVGLSFEYFGDPQPPRMRKPVTASVGPWTTYGPKPPAPGVQTTTYPPGENCTFTSDGSDTPLPRLDVLGSGSPTLARLAPVQLSDGPWCPDLASPNRFDADLLRIRSIVITLRVESAVAALRGPAGSLFTRGGSSAGGHHFLPDQEVRFEIAPPQSQSGTLMQTHRGRAGGDEGVVLVVAAMAMMLLLAIGATLVLVTSSESMIAANFRTSAEALYAADAILERALSDLRRLSDWSQALDGTVLSSFTDGRPSGVRRLADGSTIDLGRIVSMANCRSVSGCTGTDMDAITAERPWGVNNPRWRLFAFGQLRDILDGTAIDSAFYVVAFVADDSSENDGAPERDGLNAGSPNAGLGIVAVRGEAFGPRGARRAVEATIEQTALGVRLLSWREAR